jgi:hypothetical protein
MVQILGWVAEPPPIRRQSLPEGHETVRALIEVGALYAGDVLVCGSHIATVLADGRLWLPERPHHPFDSPSAAAGWVLGRSANGWIEWRCLRDGELLHAKRGRWMRGAAA